MKLNKQQIPPAGYKEAVSLEGGVCICSISILFGLIGMKMGGVNMVNTMLNTAYTLLMETVWYITAIAVVAGALSGVLAEFGVISIANQLISPLMYPLYRLPGASIISVFATYFSDNPAVLTLCDDQRFRGYFKRYQLPALTNLGTAFGMGLIISVFLISLPLADGGSFASAVMIGNVAAVIGSIVSTRLMISRTSRFYGTEQGFENEGGLQVDLIRYRKVREGTRANRLLNALLEGGQSGVKMGVAIIPGVLIICTIVLMLTNGPGEGGDIHRGGLRGRCIFPLARRKIKFYFCSALWIFFPGGNIRAGNFTWFCRGGNQPDSCHGGRRVGPCQRHCCIYRHVHVLERISQHPCCHDGQPEREAVYRNSHCLPYHRRIMCRDFSESAVPDVDDVTIR